jgi:hypothetical protein
MSIGDSIVWIRASPIFRLRILQRTEVLDRLLRAPFGPTFDKMGFTTHTRVLLAWLSHQPLGLGGCYISFFLYGKSFTACCTAVVRLARSVGY